MLAVGTKVTFKQPMYNIDPEQRGKEGTISRVDRNDESLPYKVVYGPGEMDYEWTNGGSLRIADPDDEVAELERQLEAARERRSAQKRSRESEVVEQLAALTKELQEKFKEAQKLASSIDYHFAFHSGYEEFSYQSEQDWNSSNC